MHDEKDHGYTYSLPDHWDLERILGPATFDIIAPDIAKMNSAANKGIAAIARAAKAKIAASDMMNKTANLRVARDVFWNGAYCDEDVSAEYFGGVLAQSRTDGGADDQAIYYLDIVRSLSSSQLKLHSLIYQALNLLLASSKEIAEYDVPDKNDIFQYRYKLYIDTDELLEYGIDVDIDLSALRQKGLITGYEYTNKMHTRQLHVAMVTSSALGVQLLAVAANSLNDWRQFREVVFDNFVYDISLGKASLEKEVL